MSDQYRLLKEYYGDFRSHDDSARRVAWNGPDDQRLRVEILLDAIDDADYPVSVLDVGCGEGKLYGLLRDTGRLGEYRGIDLLPYMVEAASAAYPEGDFVVGDLLDAPLDWRYDLVVCSGSLNVRVAKHGVWVQRMLHAMWERARLAVAVNFQTTRAMKFNPVAKYDNDIFHGDRATLLAWCEKITPWVSLRLDYLGDCAAFYMYRDYHRGVGRIGRRPWQDGRTDADRACGLAYLLLERRLPQLGLEVLKTADDTPRVLNFRGLCHHRLKQYPEARDCYEAALAADPTLEEARLNLDWISKKAK